MYECDVKKIVRAKNHKIINESFVSQMESPCHLRVLSCLFYPCNVGEKSLREIYSTKIYMYTKCQKENASFIICCASLEYHSSLRIIL